MAFRTSDLDYVLPDSAIAQTAIEPRDASKLLVTSTMQDDVFRNLPELLIPGDLLVVNRTRVRRARLSTVRVDTGGKVEVLLLNPDVDGRWRIMLRPSRRIRAGTRLETVSTDPRVVIDVLSDPDEGVALAAVATDGDLEDAVETIGEMPLPPYFHGDLPDDDRYQTMFADRTGSAAAPTAALHFTDDVVDGLAVHGIRIATVELEVGLDTFRPVAVDTLEEHRMHTERYLVPAEAAQEIARARQEGGRVIAVGTTVIRTLESAAKGGTVTAGEGVADMFITPGYRLAVVDAVLTNFHAPRTTLIALVATLLGERWRHIYSTALDRGYRFLSFGDAMFIDDIDGRARRLT